MGETPVSAALSPPQTSVSDASRLDKLPRLSPRQVRIFFWLLAIALGAAQAWATRFTMNPDGISYLDMGDAYWRGNWHMAINAYFSPFYSWILGFFMKVLRPSPYWEYPLAHLVNFLIYLAALGCFEFFLRNFIRSRRHSDENARKQGNVTLPEWGWWMLGYALFISASLQLITLRSITPDMCVAAFVYLASALILQIQAGAGTPRTVLFLGIVLGFAYLAKAVMFPLALVFIAVAACCARNVRQDVRCAAIAGFGFLLIASLFITILSRSKHRVTFGDSGSIAYEVYVNGIDQFVPASGSLKHPVNKIYDMPPTYEFGGPIGGTYPLWYDSTYWHEGIRPYFDLAQQFHAIAASLLTYSGQFCSAFLQLNATVALLVLYLIAPRPSACLKCAGASWPLLVIGLAAMGLYALVYAESRYFAPFIVLFWLAAFCGVHLPDSRGLVRTIAVVVVAVSITSIAQSARSTWLDGHSAPDYHRLATALCDYGITRGSKLAVIGTEPFGKSGAFSARLAKAQIVAQIRRSDLFWAAPAITRAEVLRALARAGVQAILASDLPTSADLSTGWHRLGTSPDYIHVFGRDDQ